MPEKPIARRILPVLICAAVWILILIIRLVDLQVVRRDKFVERARRQQERTIELPPRRGAILDRNKKALAVTTQIDSVVAIPSEIKRPQETAEILASILSLPKKELLRKLDNPDRDFAWVARRIPEPLAQAVASRHLEGVKILKESTRSYPQATLAANVVGYVGLDNQGLAGLEYRFDRLVRGRPAKVTVLRDAAQRLYAAPGRPLLHERQEGTDVEGASLTLTIDSGIQHVAEREVQLALETFSARGVSVVIMDPSNGDILALASAPSFDPNEYSEFDAEHRKCRPVADVYEPGSTFKVFTVGSALDAGILNENSIVDCGGGALTIGSKTIHEHGRSRYVSLPVEDVLAFSSNIGSAKIGMSLGKQAFYKSLRSLGFGQRTGIELDGETAGLFKDAKNWSALTLPTVSFGQEIGVTILQMVRGYAAIANGGWLQQPHLIEEIRRADGTVEHLRREPPRRVFSDKTTASLRRMLQAVVVKGTGKRAAVPGYTVGGKTGTAQKAVPGGGYSRDRYVASFIGMVPALNPRLVIAVVVDEPRGGRIYGGDVAAPIFSTIAGDVLRLIHETPVETPGRATPPFLLADLSTPVPVESGEYVPAAKQGAEISEFILTGIPSVAGMSARNAVAVLNQKGLRVKLNGRGFVVSQTPSAGTSVDYGSLCELQLSMEPVSAPSDALPAGSAPETVPSAKAPAQRSVSGTATVSFRVKEPRG